MSAIPEKASFAESLYDYLMSLRSKGVPLDEVSDLSMAFTLRWILENKPRQQQQGQPPEQEPAEPPTT